MDGPGGSGGIDHQSAGHADQLEALPCPAIELESNIVCTTRSENHFREQYIAFVVLAVNKRDVVEFLQTWWPMEYGSPVVENRTPSNSRAVKSTHG